MRCAHSKVISVEAIKSRAHALPRSIPTFAVLHDSACCGTKSDNAIV